MSRRYTPNKPLAVGDKVLVHATITQIDLDGDPHDPSVIVWFNGQPHSTTVMNLELPKGLVYRSGMPPSRTLDPPGQLPSKFVQETWHAEDGKVVYAPDGNEIVADTPLRDGADFIMDGRRDFDPRRRISPRDREEGVFGVSNDTDVDQKPMRFNTDDD